MRGQPEAVACPSQAEGGANLLYVPGGGGGDGQAAEKGAQHPVVGLRLLSIAVRN